MTPSDTHILPATDSRSIPVEYDLEKYTFDVPEAQVKQHPAEARHDSRLMVLDRSSGRVEDDTFKNVAEHLPTGALLVLNSSKVFPARLSCTKEGSGGSVEFLILTPLALIAETPSSGQWSTADIRGLVRPARNLRAGKRLWCGKDLAITLTGMEEFGQVTAQLVWRSDLRNVLEFQGRMPLPPYIKRDDCQEDRSRYQTIYARDDKSGSVAAPTAGLHFSPEVFESLAAKGIQTAEVTLYVGHGTFRPIRCRDIRQHRMHSEYFEVSEDCAESIRRAKSEGRPVVAVGTTTVRTLESVWANHGEIQACSGSTDLFITPGFRFQVVDHLLTNFHLPKSTLIIMVSAFAGRRRLLDAYDQAVSQGYGFFSYGDSMLIL